MKLSENMLNFLGFLYDEPHHWCSKRMGIGLAYPFGIKAALKNGLIKEQTHTIPPPDLKLPPLPGCPYGKSFDGFALTELGLVHGKVGAKLRGSRLPPGAPLRCDLDYARMAYKKGFRS